MNILDPNGPIAAAEKTVLSDSIAIMLAIVLATIAAILVFAHWFRESKARASYWPEWEHSSRIELVVWSIPTLTITLLGGVAWIGSHQGAEHHRHQQPVDLEATLSEFGRQPAHG